MGVPLLILQLHKNFRAHLPCVSRGVPACCFSLFLNGTRAITEMARSGGRIIIPFRRFAMCSTAITPSVYSDVRSLLCSSCAFLAAVVMTADSWNIVQAQRSNTQHTRSQPDERNRITRSAMIAITPPYATSPRFILFSFPNVSLQSCRVCEAWLGSLHFIFHLIE
jgi:hypothetical protein